MLIARDRYGVKPLYWTMSGRKADFRVRDQVDPRPRGCQPETSLPGPRRVFQLPEHALGPNAVRRGSGSWHPARFCPLEANQAETRVGRWWDYPFDARADQGAAIKEAAEELASSIPTSRRPADWSATFPSAPTSRGGWILARSPRSPARSSTAASNLHRRVRSRLGLWARTRLRRTGQPPK